MTRRHADARRWAQTGRRLVAAEIADLDDATMTRPSLVPGWTRKHVVGHLAFNAEALGNLVRWAATGAETPMYASPAQRGHDIARAGSFTAAELVERFDRSATELEQAMDQLTCAQWDAQVVTAQGRTVPATELPWLRAREVCVHAADLGLGVGFAELPPDFLQALREDILATRHLSPSLAGPLDQQVAYLTGRPHTLTDVPDLPPWL